MQIEIKAEDVEKIVREELIKAGLGKVITDAIAKALKPAYDNPIDQAVKTYMIEIAGRLMREVFANDVERAVRAAMEAKISKEFIDSVVAAATAKMIRAAEESRY